MTGFDGDRRRTARAFFDREGRFIDPKFRWFKTPLMWSQLSDDEKRLSPVSFDQAMTQLSNWDEAFYSPKRLPTWTNWEALSTIIESGNVATIYRKSGLLIGVRMMDGSEFIGTQTHPNDLTDLLATCGSKCDDIDIRH